MEIDEREAIRRILAGQPDLYRKLMDRHLPAVLRMTLRVTGSEADAEEAAQEAFLRAYKGLPRFREDAAFGTWVYRIAMNCALNLVSSRNRDAAWHAVHHDAAASDAQQTLASQGPSPEDALLDREAALRRERAMRTLTAMERTAFVLRHQEDQPIETIASALGISANAARQALFRAVSKLRKQLAPRPAAAANRPLHISLVRKSQ